jgi:hypothetical protein
MFVPPTAIYTHGPGLRFLFGGNWWVNCVTTGFYVILCLTAATILDSWSP